MSDFSPVMSKESPAGGFLPTDRFEVDQYVRVINPNGRTDIGQVTGFKDDKIVVMSMQGYDMVVSPRNVKRAFLLVLDLNGVLVARGKGTFTHRPFAEEFMRFVFSNFAVAVWTSGIERSSNPIIESVFAGYQDRLLFTMYRDSCRPQPTVENPWGTIKDLQVIFSRFPKSFHAVNTIIVDDSPDKCSHPDIALCPVPFKDARAQHDDDGLRKAIEVLKEVLALDSHAPVIRAAEERLEAIRAGEHGTAEAALLKKLEGSPVTGPVPGNSSTSTGGGGAVLAEVDVWKSRLCCDHLRGHCGYGDACRYSHDEDDHKRPCSRKSKCPHGHASRWIHTKGDDIVEQRRQQRMRFQDGSDAYFLSEKELKGVGRAGRMHTGIPAEDARLEQEERDQQRHQRPAQQSAQAARGRGGQAPRPAESRQPTQVARPAEPAPSVNATEFLFSTDPNRQVRVGTSTPSTPLPAHFSTTAPHLQSQQQQQRLAQLQHFQREQMERRAMNSAGKIHEGDTMWSVGGGDRDVKLWQSATGSGEVAIHLSASTTDGTALLRQLQALEAQKRR